MVSLVSDLGSNGAGYSGSILPDFAQHYENLAKIGNSMQLNGQLGKPHTNNGLAGWSNDLDSKVDLHDIGGNSGYLQDGNNPGLNNARPVSTKKSRKEKKYQKASKGKNTVYSFDEKNGVEDIISQFNLENADRVDVHSNSSIVAGDVYEIIRNGQKIKTGRLHTEQARTLAKIYGPNLEEPALQESNSLVYTKGNKGFKKLAELLGYDFNIETIVLKPENHQNNPVVTYELLDRRGEVIRIGDLTKPSKFKKLPSYVVEQISEMMDKYAEKNHKPTEKKGKRFYADYGLNVRSEDEGLTIDAQLTGLMKLYSEEGKLVALQLEGAYGRTEGGIDEIALAAGPVVKFATESGRVFSIAGFYQWLEKNGYDAGRLEHSQIGIALGTEKNKDKFRLYVGFPLSDEQLEKSTSSSSVNTTVENTDTYVRTVDTKTTTITEQVQEAVFNLTVEWEHWFKEWFAGRIGAFYAEGAEYHVKGIEHHVDPEVKGIVGGIIKLSESLRIDLEARIGNGEHAIDVYGGITYIFGSKSSNEKNMEGGQKAKNEKSQEAPELLVPVETEYIKTVRYERVKEVIEKTVTTDYKATIDGIVLDVIGNTLNASWSGTDPDDPITKYAYKVESNGTNGWVETTKRSATVPDLGKGSHTIYVKAFSDNWGPASQEGFSVENSAPTIDINDISLNEGQTKKEKINLDDPDSGDILDLVTKNLPSFARLSPLSDRVYEITLSPGYDKAGTYQTTFEVTDTDGKSKSKTITITVGNTNRAPTLEPIGNRSVFEGNTLEFITRYSDPDRDTINSVAEGLPFGTTYERIDDSSSKFSWKPNQSGTYPITFRVTDSGGKSSFETITITVEEEPPPPPPPPNNPPTASNVDASDDPIAGVTNLSVTWDYSDPNGDIQSGSEIKWWKDGVFQPAYDNLTTIDKANLSAGEEWYAKVKPKDGTDFGTEVQSDTVTVQAAPPPGGT